MSWLLGPGRRSRELPAGGAPAPLRRPVVGSRKRRDAAEPGGGLPCARGQASGPRGSELPKPPRIHLPDAPRQPRRGWGPGGRKPGPEERRERGWSGSLRGPAWMFGVSPPPAGWHRSHRSRAGRGPGGKRRLRIGSAGQGRRPRGGAGESQALTTPSHRAREHRAWSLEEQGASPDPAVSNFFCDFVQFARSQILICKMGLIVSA